MKFLLHFMFLVYTVVYKYMEMKVFRKIEMMNSLYRQSFSWDNF